MTDKPVWDEIDPPANDINVRLVKEGLHIPMFWGKDVHGHFLFIIELEGDHAEQFRKEKPSMRGVEIDLRTSSKPSAQNLILTLDYKVDSNIFQALCDTIIGDVEGVSEPKTALSIAFALLRRWQKFLAGKRLRLLTDEQIRGLLAELSFLNVLFDTPSISEVDAVEAWQGPDRLQQDFFIAGTAFEVKSITGKERNAVRISSEDQLESSCRHLYLGIFSIMPADAGGAGVSLNGMVEATRKRISDAGALAQYDDKVGEYGYIQVDAYNEPIFKISKPRYYEVGGDFPRLVRSGIPEGISRLSYDIKLENISQYEARPAILDADR